MNIISEPRYQKQPLIETRTKNLNNDMENDPQVKLLVKGMLLNREEFDLLQDTSQYQTIYPTKTEKISISNVKPLRRKQASHSNRNLAKPIAEFICETEESFSVCPENKELQELMISNNQLNLSSTNNKQENWKRNTLFTNLQVERPETSRDLVNLTTSIDTNDAFNIKATEPKTHYNNDDNNINDQNYINTIDYLNEEYEHETNRSNYQSLFCISKNMNLVCRVDTKQSTIGHYSLKTANTLCNNQSNLLKNKKRMKITQPLLIANTKEGKSKTNQTYDIINESKSMPKLKQTHALIKLNTKREINSKDNGNCIFKIPISEIHKRQINHIQLAKQCPCADHKKLHKIQKSSSYSRVTVSNTQPNTNTTNSTVISNNSIPIYNQNISKLQVFLNQSHQISNQSKPTNSNSNKDTENTFLRKHSNIYHKLNEPTKSFINQ